MNEEQSLIWLRAHFSSAGPSLAEFTEAVLAGTPAPGRFAYAHRAVERDLNWLAGKDLAAGSDNLRFLLTLADDDYPTLLRQIADPPPLLFCEGSRALLAGPDVAVVGSRQSTSAGRDVARRIASELATAGLVITSGMALGIDAAAHRGALDATGRTIAVLGTGIDQVYPRQHADLATRIRANGLVLSEFPIGQPALPYHFPRRNRIVTGLSVGTLVVEAKIRSGSLVSARLAMNQGREVFAIPGSVLSGRSSGCHLLIKDGACLVESAEDVIQELSSVLAIQQVAHRESHHVTLQSAGQPEDPLLQLLGDDVTAMEDLQNKLDLGVTELANQLLELELKGLVQRVSGGYVATSGSRS